MFRKNPGGLEGLYLKYSQTDTLLLHGQFSRIWQKNYPFFETLTRIIRTSVDTESGNFRRPDWNYPLLHKKKIKK